MSRIKASSNSLIICCFLLLTTVLLSIPHGVSSGRLSTNFPQGFGRRLNQNGDDDHSKTGLKNSDPGHDGSATGGADPPSEEEQMLPPTSGTVTVLTRPESPPPPTSSSGGLRNATPSPP